MSHSCTPPPSEQHVCTQKDNQKDTDEDECYDRENYQSDGKSNNGFSDSHIHHHVGQMGAMDRAPADRSCAKGYFFSVWSLAWRAVATLCVTMPSRSPSSRAT